MGAAFFYHLTTDPLEATLPVLLGKARAAGWRVEVRGRDPARQAALDLRLWDGGEEAFLPHGLAGGAHDAAQPVLLTVEGQAAANGAACIMSVDGAEIAAAEVGAAERVCILFDGHDAAALDHARGQWRRLTGAGCAAQYWAQDDGRWVMKSQK